MPYPVKTFSHRISWFDSWQFTAESVLASACQIYQDPNKWGLGSVAQHLKQRDGQNGLNGVSRSDLTEKCDRFQNWHPLQDRKSGVITPFAPCPAAFHGHVFRGPPWTDAANPTGGKKGRLAIVRPKLYKILYKRQTTSSAT